MANLSTVVTTRGLDAVVARLGRGQDLVPRLGVVVERETYALQAHVVEQKLTGQVLNVRTGTLRRSITARVIRGGATITGLVGTNVVYARIHEFGGTVQVPEIVPVRAKALRFVIDGKVIFARRTRAHPVRLRERSFLRSSLRERRPFVLQALAAEAKAVFTA